MWLRLLVVFVGIQLGAGLYEKLAVVPRWSRVPGEQVLEAMHASGMYAAGRVFWPFVSVPVAVLAVVNLVLARRSTAAYRRRWLAAAGCMTCYAAVSYGYFVPTMLRLQASGDGWDPAHIETVVGWWTSLNNLRLLLGAVGWLCALTALAKAGPVTARAATGAPPAPSTAPSAP